MSAKQQIDLLRMISGSFVGLATFGENEDGRLKDTDISDHKYLAVFAAGFLTGFQDHLDDEQGDAAFSSVLTFFDQADAEKLDMLLSDAMRFVRKRNLFNLGATH